MIHDYECVSLIDTMSVRLVSYQLQKRLILAGHYSYMLCVL